MSGCGFERSASSEEVSLSTRSATPGDLLVGREFAGLGRRGQRDPLGHWPDALEQLAHGRKGAHLREVARFEQVAAVGLDLVSPAIEFFSGRKTGMSWSPPLPICERTSAKATLWPKWAKASCQALACRSTELTRVPSMSKITALIKLIPFSADRRDGARQPMSLVACAGAGGDGRSVARGRITSRAGLSSRSP